MIKRKVRLKITADSRQIVRFGSTGLSAPCPSCGRDVETLTRSQAASALEIDETAFEFLVAASQVHVIQMVGGNLRVCKNSLFTG